MPSENNNTLYGEYLTTLNHPFIMHAINTAKRWIRLHNQYRIGDPKRLVCCDIHIEDITNVDCTFDARSFNEPLTIPRKYFDTGYQGEFKLLEVRLKRDYDLHKACVESAEVDLATKEHKQLKKLMKKYPTIVKHHK